MKILTADGYALGDVKLLIEKVLGHELVVASSVGEAMFLPADRILLLGGGDIHPACYGQPNRRAFVRDLPSARDHIEWALAQRADGEGIPIFGICRGMQMMAAAYGGSLHQDISEAPGGRDIHYGDHPIDLADVRYAAYLPGMVNSIHHQCVKDVPDGFSAIGHAPDGLIEVIARPRALGVQFHPELLVFDDPKAWLPLWQFFLDGLEV